jgi:hypothetical protein
MLLFSSKILTPAPIPIYKKAHKNTGDVAKTDEGKKGDE